jgi:hypothetical protein
VIDGCEVQVGEVELEDVGVLGARRSRRSSEARIRRLPVLAAVAVEDDIGGQQGDQLVKLPRA